MVKNLKTLQSLINCMMLGDKKAILNGLNHQGALLRINGIINVVRFVIDDAKMISKVIELKQDNDVVDGFTVSQFAISALHVLNIEHYNGDDEQILELIESKFQFE